MLPYLPFTKNVLVAGTASKYVNHPGNYVASTYANVGFDSNYNNADYNQRNYSLLSTSAYHNAATDGTDIVQTGRRLRPRRRACSAARPPTSRRRLSWQNFLYDVPQQKVTVQFSESVVGVAASDFTLQNTTTGQTVATGSINVAYDDATHIATLTFPGYQPASFRTAIIT